MEEILKQDQADDMKQLPVLNPDHPLLEKFQKALKQHLLEEIESLKTQIHEYEVSTLKKSEEKDNVGVRTYEAQQVLCKQQKVLEESVESLQTVTAAREALEEKLSEERVKHKEVRDKLLQTEKSAVELRNEVESTNLLVQQMTEWENKIESNITVNQRIAEKTRKDNVRLAAEKRKQDTIMYKLMKEIWRLESELETMDMQIRVKESEREEMALTVAQGNTNIEAIQAEHRCLMHSWNSVVVAVGNRDKVLGCLREEESKIEFKYKAVVAEIEQIKKLIKSELLENENHTMVKYRLNYDISQYKNRTEEEILKYAQLEVQVNGLHAIIEQIDKDIEVVVLEQKQKESALAMISKEFNQIATKKLSKEQDIVKLLDVVVLNDKSAQHMNIILKKQKRKNKEAEMKLAGIENKNIELITHIDKQKFLLDQAESDFEKIQKESDILEAEESVIKAKIDHLEVTIRKKQAELELLTNKLEKTAMPHKDQGSPQELKIVALEKSVEESLEVIKNLQSYWLREQKNLLAMSKDRQEQMHNINLLKKQILILEQKNFKITDDMEQSKLELEKIERNIRKLQSKVVILCDSLFKKKDKKEDLDHNNDILKNHYDIKLKDSELECLKIEADTTEIENEKVTLSKYLLELNREILEWEKKVILTKETKESIKECKSDSGEMGVMKAEVHRMQVRYAQLRKAQEKLVIDLEHCIARRSAIFTLSDSMERKTGENKTKINYAKRGDDMRNKLKKLENSMEDVDKSTEMLDNEILQVKEDILKVEAEIEEIKEQAGKFKKLVETGKTNRQLKFELLLMQQKKVSMYTELSNGRTPYTVYRTEQQLATEYSRQKELNNKLCKVVENLTTDFPDYGEVFTRLFNSLRLSTISC